MPIGDTALNISAPDVQDLAMQQRKAGGFVFESAYSGRPGLPQVRDDEKCATNRYASGISLGRAIAISGAAASPNMGYHTSPLIAFVLSVFNVRLGAWLPNPRFATNEELMSHEEPDSLQALLCELAGHTSTSGDFVYVSDGGHFDNLGLYEMVRRGCTRILIVDAGCDSRFDYDDLERAIRYIRADLGVSIDFDRQLPSLDALDMASHHWVEGQIDYGITSSAGRKIGRLIYVKPGLTGDEPVDVLAFAARCRAQGIPFPHHSTGNQFFQESEFESYRTLGFHTVNGRTQTPKNFLHFGLNPERPPADAAAQTLSRQLESAPEQARATRGARFAVMKWIFGLLAAIAVAAPVTYRVIFPRSEPLVIPGHSGDTAVAVDAPAILYVDFDETLDHVELPVFAAATHCHGDVRRCKIGADVSYAGRVALDAIGAALVHCVDSRAAQLGLDPSESRDVAEIWGVSDSNEFRSPDGSRASEALLNAQLADYRACKTAEFLNKRYPSRFIAKSWRNGQVQKMGESPAGDCAPIDPVSYSQDDLARLDAARKRDFTIADASGKMDVDRILATMNRRVNLHPLIGTLRGCSASDLQQVVKNAFLTH